MIETLSKMITATLNVWAFLVGQKIRRGDYFTFIRPDSFFNNKISVIRVTDAKLNKISYVFVDSHLRPFDKSECDSRILDREVFNWIYEKIDNPRPVPVKGDLYKLKDSAPWETVRAKILRCEDGWVEYSLPGTFFTRNTLKLETFLYCYEFYSMSESSDVNRKACRNAINEWA
jgi:hypothetical protein